MKQHSNVFNIQNSLNLALKAIFIYSTIVLTLSIQTRQNYDCTGNKTTFAL